MIFQDILEAGALEQYAAALNARARKAQAAGQLSAADLGHRIHACRGRCEWCGASLVGREFELDHVISLHQNGRHSAANLAVACPDCNRRKGRKHPARFAAEIYADTGRRTELLSGIMAHFALEPVQQSPLFGTDATPPEDMSAAQPYHWSASLDRHDK